MTTIFQFFQAKLQAECEKTARWLRSTDNVRFLDHNGQVVSNSQAAYVDESCNIIVKLQDRCRIIIYQHINKVPVLGDQWKLPKRANVVFMCGEINDAHVIPNASTLRFQSVHVNDLSIPKTYDKIESIVFDSSSSPAAFNNAENAGRRCNVNCGLLSLLKLPNLITVGYSSVASGIMGRLEEAITIVNAHRGDPDISIVDCQNALFEANLDEFAEF